MRLTEEQRGFAWENMGAGFFHSRRIRKARPRLAVMDRETIDQEVALAVCLASASHDGSKGKFSTHVQFRVRQGLQRALKRHPVVSPPWWFADAYYGARTESEMESARNCFRKSEAVLPSDRVADDVLDEVCSREFRDRVLKVLTPRPREIVRRHYFESQPFERIAADMGLTHQRIQQLHAQAIERLGGLYFD